MARWRTGRRERGWQEERRKTRMVNPAQSRSLRHCPITSTTAMGSCDPKPTPMQFFCTLEGKLYNYTTPVLFYCPRHWTSEGISHNLYTDDLMHTFLISKVTYEICTDPRRNDSGWKMGLGALRLKVEDIQSYSTSEWV